MRTPSHIASLAAIALAIPLLFSQAPGVLGTLLAAAGPSILVWAGTNLGVRWVRPHQRTVPLAWALGVLFVFIGIALTVPIKTHAALLDMPTRSGDASAGDLSSAAIAYIRGPLAMLFGSMFLTRSIAAISWKDGQFG